MSKKKVFFISAANSIHTVKWVNALSEKFEIHLIYCKNHKPDLDIISENVIKHELFFNAPLGYYLNAIQLKKMYKKINPDIVNVHFASGYGTLARIANLDNILLSVWGSDVYDFPNKSILNKKILRKNVLYAKYIASTSNVMAEELKRQIPDLKKDIFITPFGVDTNKFFNWNLPRKDDNINLGTVKSLEEKYGVKYAILAVNKLKKDLTKDGKKQLADKVKYYIYGDGSQKEELLKLVKAEKLERDVLLMGKIPNEKVSSALNMMDIFVAPSIVNESFGVAVVEAMACEIPIVATDVDGFKEVMINNHTGYIVKRKDINAISLALNKLIENVETRKNMGKNGRKRVVENYDWNKNVEYMKKVYEKCYQVRQINNNKK